MGWVLSRRGRVPGVCSPLQLRRAVGKGPRHPGGGSEAVPELVLPLRVGGRVIYSPLRGLPEHGRTCRAGDERGGSGHGARVTGLNCLQVTRFGRVTQPARGAFV